jgi:hypothetical protein
MDQEDAELLVARVRNRYLNPAVVEQVETLEARRRRTTACKLLVSRLEPSESNDSAHSVNPTHVEPRMSVAEHTPSIRQLINDGT